MKNIFYDTIYTDEELKEYRDLCISGNWKRTDGSVGNRFVKILNHYPNPHKILDSYLSFVSENTYGCLFNGIFEYNKGFSCDSKLAKYTDTGDDFYGWHSDDWIHHPKMPEWRRIISTITYLNDDYEGGETEFEDTIIKPESGKTLIFPSNWCFPHRGLPVTKGVKHILVVHFWS